MCFDFVCFMIVTHFYYLILYTYLIFQCVKHGHKRSQCHYVAQKGSSTFLWQLQWLHVVCLVVKNSVGKYSMCYAYVRFYFWQPALPIPSHEKQPVSLFLFLLFYKLVWFIGSFCHVWDICFVGWWSLIQTPERSKRVAKLNSRTGLEKMKNDLRQNRFLIKECFFRFGSRDSGISLTLNTESLKLYPDCIQCTSWLEAVLHFTDQNLNPLKPSSFAYELQVLHLTKTDFSSV